MEEKISAPGIFWKVSDPEHEFHGQLKISLDNQVSIEVTESGVGLNDVKKALSGDLDIGRMEGMVEKIGAVTLEGCRYRSRPLSFGGIARSKIIAKQAYINASFDANVPVSFKKIRISVEGLEHWVGDANKRLEFSDDEIWTVDNRSKTNMEIGVDDNFSMRLVTIPNVYLDYESCEARFIGKTYLDLNFEKEVCYEDAAVLIDRVLNFFSFAMDRVACIREIKAISDANRINGDFDHSVFFDVHYNGRFFSPSFLGGKSRDFIFDMSVGGMQLQKSITLWFEAYQRFGSALNLYLAARMEAYRYLDGKFLAMAQCIESFHRCTDDRKKMSKSDYSELKDKVLNACPDEHKGLIKDLLNFGNEISLRERIASLVEPFKNYFGEEEERMKMIRGIVRTRNYYTHYDKKLEEKSLKGARLMKAYMIMEVLFQMHVLRFVGFSNENIDRIAKANPNFSMFLKL